tara:strand:+ start:86 stop:502 length:417 start_codon:yes stop_codon:yes gene_type:complete
MAGITNRGKFLILKHVFNSLALPSNFYVFLVTGTPDEDDNTMADVTEITEVGKEVSLSLNSTDFDALTEDDGNDKATIQIKDCAFAGPVTAATYAVLADGNSSSADEIYAFWSLGGAKSVSSGQTLTLQDLEIDLLNS